MTQTTAMEPVKEKKPVSRLKQQSNEAAKIQHVSDALLQESFDKANAVQTGSFDYSESASVSTSKPWEVDQVAYLAKMQRAGLTQAHGAMLCVHVKPTALTLVAYSENTAEILECEKEDVELGKDARAFFAEASAMLLLREAAAPSATRQPLLVQLRKSPLEFYAILNRCEIGTIIDLEPVMPKDTVLSVASNDYLPRPSRDRPVPLSVSEACQAAGRGVARLESLPSGNVDAICEVVVREMKDLVGYDRVMAYKFHPDQHGEVVAECVNADLVPYLGLHFPATDIPQAIRKLFIRVGCRMICDARQPMVKVIQHDETEIGVNLSDSTLRSPHGCHAQYMVNMGSLASLTMAVLINDKKDDLDPHEKIDPEKKRLWGLVVCHHSSARYTPYPLRKAAEYLMQKFGTLLNKEVFLAANAHEERILRTQTRLCDMLESDVPLGIVKDDPNIMDLVKCDGAALFFANKFWLLGDTPTERQIRDIVDWLQLRHLKKNAICTDSLSEAGYPNAQELVHKTCGMVAIKIRQSDYVFWFRAHTAKEIKWGGRKHVPGEVDDGRKMHPRNSFQAFLDVVRKRSAPWEDIELEAVNGLRLMMKGALHSVTQEASPALEAGLLGEGATDIDGTLVVPLSRVKVRVSTEGDKALTEEAEVVLRCFKASFLVTDATKEGFPVAFASEAFSQLSGYEEKALLGGSCLLLEGEETSKMMSANVKAALESAGNFNSRILLYKQDQTPFWCLLTIAPVKDGVGAIRNHVLLFQEVAKYSESNLTTPKSPKDLSPNVAASDKGFPVSIIRYEGRLKEKAVRKVMELVQAIKKPGRAKTDGPLTPGRVGGIASELQVPIPSSPEASAESSKKTARRRSIVDILLGKKDAPGPEKEFKVPPHLPERTRGSMSIDPGADRDPAAKRRAHKGIDFGTTLERIEHCFLVTDPRLDENPVIFVSDEYVRTTGYSREETIGSPLIIPEGPLTSSADVSSIRTALTRLRSANVQLLSYRKTGKVLWILFHLTMVKDSDGNVLYVINVLKECGSTKLNEEQLRKAISKAEAEASSVAEALRNLPNAAATEKQWTIHSKPVNPKPHRYEDPAWAAIKKLREEEGRLGLKHFRPIRPLGNGDSGSVVLVELRGTNHLFAVKVMDKENMVERNKVHRVATEREILDHLDHPFLPTLYTSFQTAKHVCFVTDFCQGGELYDLLEAQPDHCFEENVAKFFAAEILLALEYLHLHGVIYRDLKPENVLLTNGGHVLLTDFDLSLLTSSFPKVVHKNPRRKGRSRLGKSRKTSNVPFFVAEPLTRSNSFVGTEEYIAPEIVMGSGHTAAVDWWAFGIFLYEMLYGRTPFCGNSMRKTFANVLNKDLPFPDDIKVSPEAKDLISGLLHREVDQRLGSNMGSAEIKTHPFFADVDWPLIRSKAMAAPKVPVKFAQTFISEEAVTDANADTWRLVDIRTFTSETDGSGQGANGDDMFSGNDTDGGEITMFGK